MSKKSWRKSTWLIVCLVAIGTGMVVLSESGLFASNTGIIKSLTDTGLKSLGFSFISTALITFFKEKSEDTNIEDIKTDLSIMQSSTKDISEKTTKALLEMSDTIKQFSVNERISTGRHLKNNFQICYRNPQLNLTV